MIVSGLFLSGILLATLWVSKEALRIKRQRDATVAASNPISGEMVWVREGKCTMGANDGLPDQLPLHDVKVSGFWMDKTEVTNLQFAAFVKATGYLTTSERRIATDPNAGSLAFRPPGKLESLEDSGQWWSPVGGTSWRHPEGPQSDLNGKEKHPVVHVTYEDCIAYASWAGKRLPTEAEWEYAARGGLVHNDFVWGREKLPEGHWMANIWQGAFPGENTGEDGFVGTAPVASYPANGFGLQDMAGNVWEWCADWYSADYYQKSARKDPLGPPDGSQRVIRGGSFLCADSYSKGYRPSARMKAPPTLSRADLGFRCVRSGPSPQVEQGH